MYQSVYDEVNSAFDSRGMQYEQDAAEEPQLEAISSVELAEAILPRKRFLVENLIAPGLVVLAGAPKIGKSWMVMHLCMQVAKGEPFLGMQTKKRKVLYVALEDSRDRLQQRMFSITDQPSENLFFSTACAPMGEELEQMIIRFCTEHIGTGLIVFDTFQKIRSGAREMSYANDYSEVGRIKRLADHLGICILLVHHTRKMPDNDYMNEISGTNGIAGSADTLMVLKKAERSQKEAVLSCTGRDISDIQMKLAFNRETFLWELRAAKGGVVIPEAITALIRWLKPRKKFEGGNTELAENISNEAGFSIDPRVLKRQMNCFSAELDKHGIRFVSLKSGSERSVLVVYDPGCDCTVRHNEGSAPQPDGVLTAGQDQPVKKTDQTAVYDILPEPDAEQPPLPDDADAPPEKPHDPQSVTMDEPSFADRDLPPAPTDDDAPPVREHCEVSPDKLDEEMFWRFFE